MSLQFNDETALKGIVQKYEEECGFEPGDISDDTTRLKRLTVDVNLAVDDFHRIALPAGGTWQYDDSNHTKYPILTANLVSGRRDYKFTTDQQGNLILDIYRVFVAKDAKFREITPVDVQSEKDTEGFWDGNNAQGVPAQYDKTANGIFLDPIPNYSEDDALKVYINREGSYFVYTDTTKMPGAPGIFHEYFYLNPAAKYARRNSLDNADDLERAVLLMEARIREYFGNRERDVRKRLIPNVEDMK